MNVGTQSVRLVERSCEMGSSVRGEVHTACRVLLEEARERMEREREARPAGPYGRSGLYPVG